MASKSIKLTELADIFKKVDTSSFYAWQTHDETVTRIDEALFKSSKIEHRGDFRVMCGMERN